MTGEELRHAEQVLARVIAATYAADHPELFGKDATGHPERGEGYLEDETMAAKAAMAAIPGLDTRKRAGVLLQARRDHQLRQTTDGP